MSGSQVQTLEIPFEKSKVSLGLELGEGPHSRSRAVCPFPLQTVVYLGGSRILLEASAGICSFREMSLHQPCPCRATEDQWPDFPGPWSCGAKASTFGVGFSFGFRGEVVLEPLSPLCHMLSAHCFLFSASLGTDYLVTPFCSSCDGSLAWIKSCSAQAKGRRGKASRDACFLGLALRWVGYWGRPKQVPDNGHFCFLLLLLPLLLRGKTLQRDVVGAGLKVGRGGSLHGSSTQAGRKWPCAKAGSGCCQTGRGGWAT